MEEEERKKKEEAAKEEEAKKAIDEVKSLDVWQPSKPLLWGLEEEWDEEAILKKAVHIGNLQPLAHIPESPSRAGLQKYEPPQYNKQGKTKNSRKFSVAVS